MIEVYNEVLYTNPFPGLRSFDSEDAGLFFGRTDQIFNIFARVINALEN